MNNTRLQKLLEMHQENPHDTFVLYALGMEYKGLNQNDLSEVFFKKCIQQDPQYIAAYYQLALLCRDSNKETEALNYLTRGLELLKNSKDLKTRNEFQSLKDEIEF
ncbi:MAG: hypothetical protein MH472_01635 [Bacteroidia bacterium]|nr:hypothetical protein [Bacteroidia bacterium]